MAPFLQAAHRAHQRCLRAVAHAVALGRRALKTPEPEVLERRLETLLRPGEDLLWVGRPRRVENLASLHICTAVGALVFAPIAAWNWVGLFALKPHAADVAWWGVYASAFAAVYAGSFALKLYGMDRTSFGLTRDAIVIRRWGAWTTTKVDLVSIPNLTLEATDQDLGTLRFGGHPLAPQAKGPTFEHIHHAREVFDLARAAQKQTLADAVLKLHAPPEPAP